MNANACDAIDPPPDEREKRENHVIYVHINRLNYIIQTFVDA